MKTATSFRQLAKATGYSVSNLHEKAKKGQIPERGPNGWSVPAVLAAIERNTDPAFRKPAPAGRSVPNVWPNIQPNAERIEASAEPPQPADYRSRADLPDDFARGMLFGLHALAYDLPTLAACLLADYGADRATALAAYRDMAEDTGLYIAGPCEAIGLLPENSDEAGPFGTTAFGGFQHYPQKL